jgi:hypothetical protein
MHVLVMHVDRNMFVVTCEHFVVSLLDKPAGMPAIAGLDAENIKSHELTSDVHYSYIQITLNLHATYMQLTCNNLSC